MRTPWLSASARHPESEAEQFGQGCSRRRVPRSRDPAIELAALIEKLKTRRTWDQAIALTRPGWDSAPRRIRLASGRKVAWTGPIPGT